MGMRLPGHCHDAESFWKFLMEKREGMIPVPPTRWSIEGFHDTTGRPGTIKAKEGNFLDIDLGAFDADFWSMTEAQIEQADPQQRLLLETVYEAVENAGERDIRGRNIGVYTGLFAEDWIEMHSKDSEPQTFFGYTGHFDLMDSNLVSYEFDWKGPSMTFKTGCSASMVALDTACKAIAAGDCESAIVGGTNLVLSPALSSVLSAYGVNSAEGRCRPFDAAAAGYGRGEAVSALFVKRLDHAVRDGNPIRAVIRATVCNDDGKTPGITQPNTNAHEALIRAAYRSAGLESRHHETGYFECHGTGTAVGDPLEANAVARVFGDHGMVIGSVKSNVGHSESASGNTSIIKGILALEHLTIPPNVNFNTPNPKIPWEEAKLRVPTEPLPWPKDREERLSVNSFGIGGSNSHVILESAKFHGVGKLGAIAEKEAAPPRLGLLVFSAKKASSLQATVEKHSHYLDKHGVSRLRDMAYTLANRRNHYEHRTFAIADGDEPLITQAPIKTKDDSNRPLVFIFTGQGAQWAQMGSQLIEDFPSVEANIAEMDKILLHCRIPPSWSILQELSKSKLKSQVGKAEFSQPLCTAIQIVLVDLLRSWGITPQAVAGHSSGEIAAAYASGSLTKKEAILSAYFRGYVTKEKFADGAMAAIGLGAEKVRPYLRRGVVVACENSPESTTVSGDREVVEALVETLRREAPDVFARMLHIDNAYHSHHMKAYGPAYEVSIKEIKSADTPSVPFFSSVTGETYTSPGVFDASYWRSNLESPVLFHSAVCNIVSKYKNPVVVEIGPHSALAGPLRQIFQSEGASYTYIPSLQRGKDDTESMYTCLGSLWCNNFDVNFDAVNPIGHVLTDLPSYSWDHSKSYWKESRMSREWRERNFIPHEALGVRLPGSSHLEPTWRNLMTLNKAGWVRDHVVGSDIVLPGAAYVAMAGEAVRQLTGRSDYSIRNLAIKTAMIFQESKENDVITTLKKSKLTSKDESEWWEFRVTSFNGSIWNEHCSGRVKAGPVHDMEDRPAPPQPDFPRKLSAKRWYNTMQKIGFAYGPTFRGLKEISVNPITFEATATIENIIRENESFYELHPCEIDKLLQLMTVTQHGGDPTMFKQLSMPTYIDEVYISAGGAKEFRVTATSQTDHLDTWSGNCLGTADGKVVFELRSLSVSAMGASADAEEKPKNAVELVWKPDIDFLDAKDLMLTPLDLREFLIALEKYFFVLALETIPEIAAVETKESHLVKFRDWLNRFVDEGSKGENRLLPEGKTIAALGNEDRKALLKSLTDEFEASPVAAVATALRRVQENARARFEGTVDTLDFLMEGGVLTQIYAFFDNNWDYSPFLQAIGHKKPTLRVLEIGAGTGGTTSNLLTGLRSEFGECLYSKYTYTDISAGFFVAAKERFKDYPGMEFQVLDISRDPVEQGFEAGGYDLILAANVIHATPRLQETLKNVRKLLHPQGRLLLQELDMQAKWMGFIMGGFSGWWLGEVDARPDQPYVSPERWDRELKTAGFSGVDAVAYDNEHPYQVCSTMIAGVGQAPIERKPVTFLYRGEVCESTQRLKDAFEDAGHAVTLTEFGGSVCPDQDIIALLELHDPFVDNISEPDFDRLMGILRGLDSTRIVWLTRSCSMGVSDPRFAQILGLSRTLRSEKHVSFTTFEVDDISSLVLPEKTVKLYEQIHKPDNDLEIDPDYEYALKDGVVYMSRYHWFSVSEKLSTTSKDVVDKYLVIGQKGMIDSLRWEENTLVQRPLRTGEIRVKPHTVGVNFRDVLQTQGVVDGDDLGGECSGTILEVGPGVTDFQVGDRVFVVESYCFSNQIITHQDLMAKIPDGLSMEGAATMSTVFTTVIYALCHLRRLQKDETILIHSACGGVGIASIQIAQMVGAKIFATVGNEEKVQYLMDTFGLPREQIFDSHSNRFVNDVMAATKGRGVDVALNSLAGELLHATWSCIAPFGCMIEIGKRDFYGHGKLDMFQFTVNRSFLGLDARHIQSERPEVCGQMLRECARYFEEGHVKPIQTYKNFPATEVAEAFRHMQKGTHIGKFTVTMPEDFSVLPVTQRQPSLNLQADASYFLVGGLGGVGRSIASWFVKNGAKNLVFLSRSGRSAKVEDFCQELEVLGCNVQVFKGSVSDMDDVKRAVSGAAKPIRGVVQLSMALQDRAIDTMSFEDWYTAIRPKVDGTWNLHNAMGDSLDFFVMFSSTSGVMGQYGQANYAAANCFLDAFTQYRHSQGLAASVIDLGVMEDVGFVAESATLLDYFRFLDANLLSEEDMRECVRLAIARSFPAGGERPAQTYSNPSEISVGVLSYAPLSDPNNRIIWKKDRRFSVYRNIEMTSSRAATTDEGLKSFLLNMSSRGTGGLGEESVEFLSREIGETLYGFMMKDPEDMQLDLALGSLGLDSLVAIELRNWYRSQIGFDISILEIMQSTLRGLGKKALDSLVAKHT
ncbi:Lovastatin nonaketide synthase [Escovopsis weberi]|uniref:Lovastatin nonaketide synthase n=1 Tax=Escovopsis weberi TaxID=150374 RepID=A0A0M8MZM6_ESCWE|nr:Lovastatin nonaketide synthase [Escovopsis weberi]